MKTDENQRNSMKFNETQWKSMKIDENLMKHESSMKIDENQWNQWNSMKINFVQFDFHWGSMTGCPGSFFRVSSVMDFHSFIFFSSFIYISFSFHFIDEMKWNMDEMNRFHLSSFLSGWNEWNAHEHEMISSFHLSFVSLLNSRSGSAHLFISRVPAPGSSTSNSTWFKIFKKQLLWNVLFVLFLKTD